MLSTLFAGSIFALSLGKALATVSYKGINIAGFDFGAQIDGSCILSRIYGPVEQLRYGNNPDGAGQMTHFTNTDGFNIYRLPVAWQFLVSDNLGGTLDATNFGQYDLLVQACLATGSHCIIDIHNFARWDGGIIGQGGPTNDQFASLWSQLAAKYASQNRMIFGLMNEPHDMPNMDLWGQSCQVAVTAIRSAGATSQMILLPGNDYTSAGTFVSSGSAAALASVTNLDGSITGLIFDLHKYLDSDNSGTHVNCVTNNIDDAFAPLATYLRSTGRQALLSETGGGSSDSSCLNYVCQELAYIEANSDVYLGYLGWAAGSFATNYILSLTPFGSATTGWTDQELVTQCFKTGGGAQNYAPPPVLPTTTVSAVGNAVTNPQAASTTQTSTMSAVHSTTSTISSTTSTAEHYQPPSTFSTIVKATSTTSTVPVPSATDDGGDDDTCEL